MTDTAPAFDPYYKWLGIPPKEQPPTHYRLLGIAPLEADADVIEAAAEQRMAHLRARQTGTYGALTQKLLNEIAVARSVLLDPGKKRTYDAALRPSLSATAAGPVIPAAKPPQEAPQTQPFVAIKPSQPANRRSDRRLPLLVATGAVLVVIVAIIVVIGVATSGRQENSVAQITQPNSPLAQTPAPAAHAPPAATSTESVQVRPKTEPAKDNPAEAPTEPAPPTSIAPAAKAPPTQTQGAPPVPGDAPESPGAKAGPPAVSPRPAPKPTPAANPIASDAPVSPASEAAAPTLGRQPVPDTVALEKARQNLKELYGEELTAAKTPQQKSVLAARLLDIGRNTVDDVAGRYAVLDSARRVAEMAGDLRLSFRAVDQLAESFDVNAASLKADLIDVISRAPARQNDWKELAEAAAQVTEEAVAANDYAMAERVAEQGQNFARKTRNKESIAEATAALKHVKELAAAYEPLRPAFARLQSDPDDPSSNLAAGRFLCFQKGDWDAGLPLLLKAGDRELTPLARLDLEAALSPMTWTQVGDGWLAYAADVSDAEADAARKRAAWWYRQALPNLAGLSRAKVEKTLKEIDPAEESVAATRRPKGRTSERAAPSAPAPVGSWTITYRSGAVRHYQFDGQGNAFFIETKKAGRMARNGEDFILDFGDGKLERFRWDGSSLHVDHFDPVSRFPDSPTLTGRGEKGP